GNPDWSNILRTGIGMGDPLTGSAFEMNQQMPRGGVLSFWSNGSRAHFDGRDGTLSLNGAVRSMMFGFDYAKGSLMTGLTLAHSRGLGRYADMDNGELSSSMTGLYPWLGYKATDRITVWGVAGYGAGGLLLTPHRGPVLESNLSMVMAAGGTRGELVAKGAGGFGMAFKAEPLHFCTGVSLAVSARIGRPWRFTQVSTALR
ncbi:MAG: hypothetical protein J4F29_06860, partial [Candidatus Latescibacteria bacterium]|nr:hypothetical protein [Candidatus Latescibacterota bacterium]